MRKEYRNRVSSFLIEISYAISKFKESLYGKVKIALYIDSIWQKKLFPTSTNWWLLKNRYIAILKSISYQGQGDILHQIERYLQWRIYEILIFFR